MFKHLKTVLGSLVLGTFLLFQGACTHTEIIKTETMATPKAANLVKLSEYAQERVVFVATTVIEASVNGIKHAIPGGSGSGVVLSKDGYIVTNAHVAASKNNKIMVEFLNHKKFSANIVGIDTDMDLCLLKISVNEQLPFMPIGDSDAMDAGSHVLAIGNPLGLKHTVTSGIISFKHRIMSMSGFEDFLQTDAAINPGNSGGALMNMRGELVGINTAIMRDATGLGFAIPSNTVAQVIAQFKATGKYTHPWLGIVMQYLSSDLAEQFKATEGEGVLVSEVLEGSPAGDVGIQAGDVIVSKSDDAEPFSEPVFVSVMVHKHNVGDKINFVVLRNQVKLHFSVTLKPRPEEKKVENEQVPH